MKYRNVETDEVRTERGWKIIVHRTFLASRDAEGIKNKPEAWEVEEDWKSFLNEYLVPTRAKLAK